MIYLSFASDVYLLLAVLGILRASLAFEPLPTSPYGMSVADARQRGL